MFKIFLIACFSLFAGFVIGYIVFFYTPVTSLLQKSSILPQKQIVGFLPYFLLNRAKTDYSQYLTTLTYFGLRVDGDGSILKLTSPTEEEPGWHALSSGKITPYLKSAQENGEKLSLLVANGSQDSIDSLISAPVIHAKELVTEIVPIMKKYQFKDFNLDIERTGEASVSAQENFTLFIKTVKNELDKQHVGTLTLEVSPTDLIKQDLINIKMIAPYIDYLVVMGYDYHYSGSYVTGPVAPLYGAGVTYEFDIATAIGKAMEILPKNKIILGLPLYGYSWETIESKVRTAVIPNTGFTESSRTVSDLLSTCSTCSATFDFPSQESYVVYKDMDTGTFHQIFFPDAKSTLAKIKYAQQEDIGGVALWALGYEDSTILSPLELYKNSF